jgi:hypothetical protein
VASDPTERLIQEASSTSSHPIRRFLRLVSAIPLLVGLGVGVWLCLWAVRPDLLPQRAYYDFVENRQVTERLVDPALLKLDRWEITGRAEDVLFTHPTTSGSVALVYPVKVRPRTTFMADVALAPEAWTLEGDGVTFSLYLEDSSGMHLLRSCYVDSKHHQADRRWVPFRADLAAYNGKLSRVILAVGSGPAGDGRFDWAGWGEPRLTQPIWP